MREASSSTLRCHAILLPYSATRVTPPCGLGRAERSIRGDGALCGEQVIVVGTQGYAALVHALTPLITLTGGVGVHRRPQPNAHCARLLFTNAALPLDEVGLTVNAIGPGMPSGAEWPCTTLQYPGSSTGRRTQARPPRYADGRLPRMNASIASNTGCRRTAWSVHSVNGTLPNAPCWRRVRVGDLNMRGLGPQAYVDLTNYRCYMRSARNQ